jgi:predicted small secreted protein
MKRALRVISPLAVLALAAAVLAGCGGTYAGYTEYRAAPVKSAAELRQEEIARQRRIARDMPGGANEARGPDTPW